MRGFTLVELLISVSIFATVMVMSLGALLAMSESNRRVESMKSVINTLNFALDSMSRSIRTGYSYECDPLSFTDSTSPEDCPSDPSTKFAFTNSDGVSIGYCLGRIDSLICDESSEATAILRSEDGGPLAPITSREVVIEDFAFYVIGSLPGDNTQPKVTILISGYVDVSATQRSTFNLQTSVTQRIYDQ